MPGRESNGILVAPEIVGSMQPVEMFHSTPSISSFRIFSCDSYSYRYQDIYAVQLE